jgi:hypothetical protein
MADRMVKDMSNRLGMDVLMSLVAGKKMEAVAGAYTRPLFSST